MKTTRVFFDCEFTGLHQNTSLISIGLVSDCGKTFYAELTDYDLSCLNDDDKNWLERNVISKLTLSHKSESNKVQTLSEIEILGSTKAVQNLLTTWFSQFDQVEIWGDCLSYDWVLFCQIFGHAFYIPKNVYYIPFDICTLFWAKGIDPDINRDAFSGIDAELAKKHNALWDAQVIKACFEKLMQN